MAHSLIVAVITSSGYDKLRSLLGCGLCMKQFNFKMCEFENEAVGTRRTERQTAG